MSPYSNLEVGVSVVIASSVAVVLLAVAANFVMARSREGTRTEKRSPVATATMLLFLAGFYVLIHRRIGQVDVADPSILLGCAVLGCIVVVIGAAVNVWGRLGLGQNWADQATLYSNQTLVTTGLFAYLRHPLYASLIWMYFGASVAYHNAAAFTANLLVFLPAMAWRASLEERMLSEKFPEYESYCSRTGRFIPWRKRGNL